METLLSTNPFLYEFLNDSESVKVRSKARHDLANDPYVAASTKFVETPGRKVRELIDTGLPVAIGTDVGLPVQLHGAIWREIDAWRRSGVPPESVLRAATAVPAAILGEFLGRTGCHRQCRSGPADGEASTTGGRPTV